MCQKKEKLSLTYLTFEGHVTAECEDGWRYGDFHCYMFSVDMISWFEGQAHCDSMGGKMMTVESHAEAVSTLKS